MVNVVAVFQNFGTSSTYYSYSNFGGFRILEFVWSKKNSVVFQNQMQDLNGSTLPILFGGVEPGLIISQDVNGDKIFGGFLGHMFHAFAKKHNAILNTSSVNTSLSSNDIHHMVLNRTIEISGAGVKLVQFPIEYFSYPYTTMDWGVMLPVESSIPIYKVFAFVFHWEAFVLTMVFIFLLSVLLKASVIFSGAQRLNFMRDIFFNIDCFRGILGQPFFQLPRVSFTTKIIYSCLFLLGIIIVTSYDAFLQSFMTKPPRTDRIKSFDDLKLSGLKIYALKFDVDEYLFKLKPKFMEKYSNLFISESNFETFTKLRNTLNTKYAFTISETKWEIYVNRQKYFSQQLFRWSKELCLLEDMLSAISINENSIFKQILDFHILETQSSGLLDFWIKRAFFELIKVGKVEKVNIRINSMNSMKVEDLKWIWIYMGISLMAANLCFIGEICIFNLKKRGNNRKQIVDRIGLSRKILNLLIKVRFIKK
ncbi:uncharacterized protein LOC129918512 [Episyrphus balteatus]|uniref:uncharacterized protein LOC129918512 n=1 Tax=Episyrphus balteatus TaxID=286459 RepID=UPI0024863483|nr:uncharacterized protein LOC129918512 [Episyrphus balteatus]